MRTVTKGFYNTPTVADAVHRVCRPRTQNKSNYSLLFREKNTDEMIKMVDILRRQYGSMKRIYISWDAAGWHLSKALGKHVEFLNDWAEHDGAPTVDLAPLPSRAPFLNVIESVFSGMSRAVIHNSNFENSSRARSAIDRYFQHRNEDYKIYPKRAGHKLWQQERCEASVPRTE